MHPAQVWDGGKGDRRVAVGEAGQRVGDSRDEVVAGDRAAHQQHLSVGVAQQPGEFGARREGRQRDGERADARRGQPRDEPLGTVGEQDADPGSLADARGQQRIGQCPGLRVGLGETQPLLVGDQELAVRLRAPP